MPIPHVNPTCQSHMPIPHADPTCRSHMPISDLFKGNHVGEVIRPRMIEGNAVDEQLFKNN